MSVPRVEIISTGEEVIHGELVDTNAVWLSQKVVELGFHVQRRITVGDRMSDLVSVFRERAAHADVVVVSGGLGPTTDDLTAEAAALAKGEPRVIFEEWAQHLRDRFSLRGREMPDNNLKQALLAESAVLVDNPIGTACGFRLDIDGTRFYFTPGVPREMKRMMSEIILPEMAHDFGAQKRCLRRLHTFGVSEARMDEWLNQMPRHQDISLGFRAHLPLLEVKVLGVGDQATVLVEQFLASMPEKVRESVVARDDQSMAQVIGDMCRARAITISTAESCTGGLLADAFIHVAGSSDYFVEGAITYSNRAKQNRCDVNPQLLDEYGAVSLEVARAMALGMQRRAESTLALSTTGIAGPGGGSDQKPVGTLGLGLATESGCYSQLLVMPDFGRTSVRLVSTFLALDMLRRYLSGLDVFAPYEMIKRLQQHVS